MRVRKVRNENRVGKMTLSATEVALAKNIIYDVNYHFTCWTKSCVFYSINRKNNFLTPEFIHPFTLSKNEVLKNTAEFIFYKANSYSAIK